MGRKNENNEDICPNLPTYKKTEKIVTEDSVWLYNEKELINYLEKRKGKKKVKGKKVRKG